MCSRAQESKSRSDHALTAALAKAHSLRLPHSQHTPYLAFACACGSGYCYKVMRLNSVQRSLERKQKYPITALLIRSKMQNILCCSPSLQTFYIALTVRQRSFGIGSACRTTIT